MDLACNLTYLPRQVYANSDLELYLLRLHLLWQVYANSDSELPWKESLVTAEPEVGRHSKYSQMGRDREAELSRLPSPGRHTRLACLPPPPPTNPPTRLPSTCLCGPATTPSLLPSSAQPARPPA